MRLFFLLVYRRFLLGSIAVSNKQIESARDCIRYDEYKLAQVDAELNGWRMPA